MRTYKKILLLLATAAVAASAAFAAGCAQGTTVTVRGGGRSYALAVEDDELEWADLVAEYPALGELDTGMMIDAFFTDEDCLVRFTGPVEDGMTVWFAEYSPAQNARVVFVYDGDSYGIYRPLSHKLSEDDFARSALGREGEYAFWSDEDCSRTVDLASVALRSALEDDVIIYVTDK